MADSSRWSIAAAPRRRAAPLTSGCGDGAARRVAVRARTSATDSTTGDSGILSQNSSVGPIANGRDAFGTVRSLGVRGVRRIASGGRGVAGSLISGSSPTSSNAWVNSGSLRSVRSISAAARSVLAVVGSGTARAGTSGTGRTGSLGIVRTGSEASGEDGKAVIVPSSVSSQNVSSHCTATGRLSSSEERSVRSISTSPGLEVSMINEKS